MIYLAMFTADLPAMSGPHSPSGTSGYTLPNKEGRSNGPSVEYPTHPNHLNKSYITHTPKNTTTNNKNTKTKFVFVHTAFGTLVALVVKNPPANAGDVRDTGSIPGFGRSPAEGNGNPSVFLPGESHRQRSLAGFGPWGRRVRHD